MATGTPALNAILGSILLVALAAALLLAGIVTGGEDVGLLLASIGLCLVAAVMLGVGVARARPPRRPPRSP